MNKLAKFFVTMLCAALLAIPVVIAGCAGDDEQPEAEFIDYVSTLSLDFTSETKKQEVTVRMYVDGDTTHFNPVKNSSLTPNTDLSAFDETQGIIKARYLAINTPESTGRVEKWGKTASNFTHDKLASSTSIIVESDDGNWNSDSTGTRFLLWIWYMPEGGTEYRNLNLEILQEGFALGSSTANNRYGEIASEALEQAKEFKLHVYSPANTVDENFYDGEAIELSLKDLRCHIDDYVQVDVRVTGVVTAYFNNYIYIQDYDEETGLYFGIYIFDGYATGPVVGLFKVGNEVSVWGTVTEFNGSYQISGIRYDRFEPDDPKNSQVITEGSADDVVFTEVSAKDIVSGEYEFEFYDEEEEEIQTVTIAKGEAIVSTAVTVSNLTVLRTYTTTNSASSDGAISLYCQAEDGTQITVRTEVLKDANGDLLNASDYNGKKITVKGVIEQYEGSYQVKCYLTEYLMIVG